MDTSSLTVLHFKNDGSCEEIQRPRVFTENGKKYVSIIVTSFSDFAIAERGFDIESINVNDKTVKVYTGGAKGTLTVPVYNESGRMLESISVKAGSRSEVTLTLEKLVPGSTIKMFYMDSNKKPLYEAKELAA